MFDIGFMAVKRGDRVRRMLADAVPMDLYVVRVDERLIYAALSESVSPTDEEAAVWTFDRATGIEEDEDLGWGILRGVSGSRLTEILSRKEET